MSAGTTEQVRPELALHRVAAAVHESMLQAASRAEVGDTSIRGLIQGLLDQHGPCRTTTGQPLFVAAPDPPVCQGCDRADLTPTRAPVWPCRTYRRIAQNLATLGLFHSQISPAAQAVLVRLDEHRHAAGRGVAEARHRGPRPVDATAG